MLNLKCRYPAECRMYTSTVLRREGWATQCPLKRSFTWKAGPRGAQGEVTGEKGRSKQYPILAVGDLYAVPGVLDFTVQVMEATNESDPSDDFGSHVEDELERPG